MRAQAHRRAALALALTAALALAGCGSSGSTSSTSTASTAALVSIGSGLMGPAGLRATLYGSGPQSTAAFTLDPHGRLWVAAAGLETHSLDGVYLLPHAGGRAVRVISGLNDPLGLAWFQGSLYVASVGRVDAYSGFDGRRFASHREVIRGPLAGGENNALVMAPDGRFVMGITASCDHCTPASRWSGSIVSFLPDGGGLRLYAARVRAPVGLAYLPGSSDLFVTINQRDDLGALTPGDLLAQIDEGQSWGFPSCWGQGGAVCAGVPDPVAVLDKHAAVGSVAIVTGQLGEGVGTSAIVPEWNVAKVQRVALRRSASGFQGTVSPFITGIEHPLAVVLAPDGSLLLGDWATGRIYRVAQR